MAMKPPPRSSCSCSSSPALGRASDVLCDAFLLRLITSFQRGFPRDIIEWERATEPTLSPWYSALEQPGGVPSNLPNLAVQTNNLPMLEQLYRYHKEQPAYFSGVKAMALTDLWAVALKSGNVGMVDWIFANDPTLSQIGDLSDKATIRLAISSPGVAMTKWLLAYRPRYMELGHLFVMDQVAATGNVDLYQWLVANVANVSPCKIDAAAARGHLDMVRYLHDLGTAGCTANAMNLASCGGHLKVVQFLHENRNEGCTENAMNYAAQFGHLEVVQFLHENRNEECTENAMDNAAFYGHLEVVRFLHEHRKEAVTRGAMTAAVSGHHFQIVKFLQQNRTEGCHECALSAATEHRDLEMVRFLHDHYPEHSMAQSLSTAAAMGQLDIVQYIVENTTQGCVFDCLKQAKKCLKKSKKVDLVEIEAYLTAVVDPSIRYCKLSKHHPEDTKRVCQK